MVGEKGSLGPLQDRTLGSQHGAQGIQQQANASVASLSLGHQAQEILTLLTSHPHISLSQHKMSIFPVSDSHLISPHL